MKSKELELYSDFLIANSGQATATGLAEVLGQAVSHDPITRFLSEREYTSKDLWRAVKAKVREIERDDGCLIFDDTIQEKAWTDKNDIICWHFDHSKGRSVKGLNLLNALYHTGGISLPVAFEIVKKPVQFCDVATRQVKRASEVTKNEQLRAMIQSCVIN